MNRTYIPDIIVEQFILDELPGEKTEGLRNNPDFDRQVDRIKKSSEEILKHHSYEQFAVKILERLNRLKEEKRAWWRNFFVTRALPMGVLSTAVILIVIGIISPAFYKITNSPTVSSESTRIKAVKPNLLIYRDNNGKTELLKDSSIVRKNDRLQLAYNAAGWKYGVIFSFDGRGTVTLHFPEDVSNSSLLTTRGEVILPYSYRLDDAPGFEKFYFITADTEIPVKKLLDDVKAEGERAIDKLIKNKAFTKHVDMTMLLLRKKE
ncbi:MAG: hypothetical protein AB1798_20780 [Spirochaetota bacterium]